MENLRDIDQFKKKEKRNLLKKANRLSNTG